MDYKPTIPPKVRDVVYITAFIATPTIGLIAAVVAIWFPGYSEPMNATAVALGAFIGTIVGGLAAVYRPGAQT